MNSSIATFCALAIGLAALPIRAESGNETRHPAKPSASQHTGEYNVRRETLLAALSKAPDSPALLNSLGSVAQDAGEYLDAERFYLRALGVSEAIAADPERLAILNNLGTLYLDTNQYSKCERMREQLESLPLAAIEEHPAQAGGLLNVIGSLEHARNRDDEAERYYSRSLLLFRHAYGPVNVDAAQVEANLGFIRLENGQYESATAFFVQAIREIEIASGTEEPALIRPFVNLARSYNKLGDAGRAEPAARRAVELSIRIFGAEHPTTAAAMLEQAAALRRLGHAAAARDLEKRAKACRHRNLRRDPGGYTVGLRDLSRAAR